MGLPWGGGGGGGGVSAVMMRNCDVAIALMEYLASRQSPES